jgi:hypothetical protein
MRTRPRITWLIGGAVAALLVLAGVDALRSAVSKTSAPTASTPTTKPASGPKGTPTDTGWGYSAPIRQYVFAAHGICAQANGDLLRAGGAVGGARMEQIAGWNEAAARAAENSLTKLRALPAPEPDQAVLDDFFSGAEEEIDALRQVAASGFGRQPAARARAPRQADRCDPPRGRARRQSFRALASR